MGLWALVLAAAWLLAPAAARGEIVGSPHDFSVATGPFTKSVDLAAGGACFACHIPHGADRDRLWARNLEPYRTNLVNNGSPSSVWRCLMRSGLCMVFVWPAADQL